MTILRHELRQNRTVLALWTLAIGLLLAACVLLYPEMRGEMGAVGEMFASMGSFTAAFGMDRLNIGTLTGYYCVECGNILGLGGALCASLMGATALSGEERGGTAEFLLTHPVSRARAVTEKLAAALAQIILMDLAILALSLLAMRWIGEPVPWRALLPLHAACLWMHLELACVCFGLSAFQRRGGGGFGMGLAAGMYALNLLANLSERARFLKFVTPFAYCEGADIVANGAPDIGLVALGMCVACIGVAAAYWRYLTKDIG